MSVRKVAAVALLVGLVGLSAADDDKKPAAAKATDFAGWLKYNKLVVGEVAKSDDNGISLKVITGYSRGKPQFEKMQFVLHDAGLVRWKKLPPKTDDKGKRLPYTREEMTELRSPRGAPGYAADPADLKPGYMIELTLVRPREVPLSKLVFQDLRVQYAVILTEDKAARAGGKKDDEKKKDEKKGEKKDEKKKEEKKDGEKKG
ncbi:MAG TPA: hypothetical protein VFG68_13475 [Fimbriiglobus sp.]|nr:hypothetical protein [Fimbriiglobus sp.]